MIKVKDGYAKLIGTTYSGSVSRVLLSNGGDHILGNSNGNIPLNNGTVNTNLNADMLDGLHIHAGRNNEVNKIVRTDANGFLQTGWINTTSGNIGTGAINKIYCSNDDYIRYKTPANFFPTLANSGNDISITVAGQNRTLTVGYATNADKVDGYHASDFASSSHSHNYAVNENYGGFKKAERLPTSGFYQSYISKQEESGGNAPQTSWMHLINCQHSNTDNNYALQIAASFFDNNIFKIRVTNNNVNNAWRDIIHSGNIGSQSVNYANSAGNADTATNAYHLRINSANTWSTWYWAGQSGQPSWLWGSNDGTNMYVWDPNNFNVNTAQYLRSLGNQNCQTGRTQNYGDVYTYNTITDNTGSPTEYTSVIGFGRGIGGTVEIAGGWCNTGLYWRSLRDCCDDWYSWRTVLDSSNYTGFVDNYYWANVKISTSSSTTTSPTVSNLTATNSIKMGTIYLQNTNEINSASGIHLNYQNSGNVSLCEGGGKVGIGTTAPSYKLDVNGNIWCRGALNVGSTLSITDSVINCSSSNISIKSKESGSLMIGSQEVIGYGSNYTSFYNKVSFSLGLSLQTDTPSFTSSTYTTDNVTVLIGTLMNNSDFQFRPANDGQLLFLKVGRAYSNVYLRCTAKDCEVVKANGFDVHLARNVTKNYFGDGLSRIFIYKQLDERWYEFYCG